MRLKALDQIHISAVKPDVIRPREEITVDDAVGAAILKDHPNTFRIVPDAQTKAEKAAPKNKAIVPPTNKAV